MTITEIEKNLEGLNKLTSLQKATKIKQIVGDFHNSPSISSLSKEDLIKRLQKVIYTIRMELAFNKATESNTGNLDKELAELSKQLG